MVVEKSGEFREPYVYETGESWAKPRMHSWKVQRLAERCSPL